MKVDPSEGVKCTAKLPKGYNYAFIKKQAELLGQGKVMVHASAVEEGGFATVYCGPSYSGKTHRALARCKSGARLLGDDFIVLSKGRVEPFITPIHMKQSYGFRIPRKYLPKRLIFWFIRRTTGKRPYIEVPPIELGISIGNAAPIGSIEILGDSIARYRNSIGSSIAEKIYRTTIVECGFAECAFKAEMREMIRLNIRP